MLPSSLLSLPGRCLLAAVVLSWPAGGTGAPAPPDRGNPEAGWLAEHKGMKKTMAVTLRMEAGAKVRRTARGLWLPVTIANNTSGEVTTTLAHEWHGGEWPSTDLYAAVTPAGAGKLRPFHPVYLFGEPIGKASGKVKVPAGQSVKVLLRLDWPGTGSVPAQPLLEPSAHGTYEVRLLLVVDAGGKRYAVGGPARVELARK